MGFYFTNLWRAFLQLFSSSSPLHALVNLDRFGNALAAGHHRATVSARVGYFELTKKGNKYWKVLVKVIDETFRPIDGANHCYRAYCWEKKANAEAGQVLYDYRRGSDIALFFLSILVFAACLVLAPVIYLIALLKPLFKRG